LDRVVPIAQETARAVMSRLDSFINRLQAQRACLDFAAASLAGRAGPVLEIGLGNGRTFDHLRSRLPDNPIYVFDYRVAAHANCVPAADRLFLGDFRETLPRAAQQLGRHAVLAHGDFGGSADASETADVARAVARWLKEVMAPGGLVVCDQRLDNGGDWTRLDPPPGVPSERYFMWRVS
jgi:hypothetical protein